MSIRSEYDAYRADILAQEAKLNLLEQAWAAQVKTAFLSWPVRILFVAVVVVAAYLGHKL